MVQCTYLPNVAPFHIELPPGYYSKNKVWRFYSGVFYQKSDYMYKVSQAMYSNQRESLPVLSSIKDLGLTGK